LWREALSAGNYNWLNLCISPPHSESTTQMSHKKYRAEKNCLNCGAVVEQKFCPNCGQENLDLKENFLHIAGHVIGDFFHYDSKFFRSIIPLFTKPGFLTKEYWEGKRVNYIHPLRLFFFVTVIFMVSTTYFYNHFDKKIMSTIVQINVDTTKIDTTLSHAQILKQKAEQKSEEEKIKSSSSHGVESFFKNLKYVSFFLLPVYALIFSVLYRRRKGLYVDHLVFVLHIQSFAYILISATILTPFIFPESIGLVRRLTIVIIAIYMIFSLRRLYHQGWAKTIIKSVIATLSMVLIMGVVLGLFVVAFMLFR
jgi:hypothetical protein